MPHVMQRVKTIGTKLVTFFFRNLSLYKSKAIRGMFFPLNFTIGGMFNYVELF